MIQKIVVLIIKMYLVRIYSLELFKLLKTEPLKVV